MNPRRIYTCLALIVVIALFAVVFASAQVTTSPGKLSAYMTTAAFTIPGNDEKVVAAVKIAKGLKAHVLEVDASLQVYAPQDTAVYVLLRANGVIVYGDDAAQDCQDEVACSVVANGWLNLDAAEKKYPGRFIGKTILIEMIAGNARASVPSATATLRTRLQRK